MLRADVLIVTAIKEEFDALIAVEEGAVSGSVWRSEKLEDDRIYAVRRFTHSNSAHAFTVVATWATRMGEVAAVTTAVPLIERFRPRAIAMCGVCAGRRGDVQRGDVICANQVWQYEAGKTIAEYDDDGQRREDFKASLMVHQPDRPWVQAAQAFRTRSSVTGPPNTPCLVIKKPPPPRSAKRKTWNKARFPRKHPEHPIQAPPAPAALGPHAPDRVLKKLPLFLPKRPLPRAFQVYRCLYTSKSAKRRREVPLATPSPSAAPT
ncbi:MAG TPA: hypothetical protein PLA94_24530, partial [Myxococcota bacterium]|nr:hypothetical protein [Myxococcota bacterium]